MLNIRFQRQVPLPLPCYDFAIHCSYNSQNKVCFTLLTKNVINVSPLNLSQRGPKSRVTGGLYVSLTIFTASLWYAITSDSIFMFSSYRKQSGLGWLLMFAYTHVFASYCDHHCTICVAQSISPIPTWLAPLFLQYFIVICKKHTKEFCPLRYWNKRLKARASDSHAGTTF